MSEQLKLSKEEILAMQNDTPTATNPITRSVVETENGYTVTAHGVDRFKMFDLIYTFDKTGLLIGSENKRNNSPESEQAKAFLAKVQKAKDSGELVEVKRADGSTELVAKPKEE